MWEESSYEKCLEVELGIWPWVVECSYQEILLNEGVVPNLFHISQGLTLLPHF